MKRISRIVPDIELDLSPLDSFIGKSCYEIDSELGLGVNLQSKSFVRPIIEKLLVKCGIQLDSDKYSYKLIRVDDFGKAKNPSSLKVTDYHTIINEEWENSEFRQLLEPMYIFFVVTHGNSKTSVFKGYILHRFTDEELQAAKIVWTDTRDKIRNGIYDRFLTDKDTGTFFFKCHAASVACQADAPKGGQEITRSFWLSRKLVSKIVSGLH